VLVVLVLVARLTVVLSLQGSEGTTPLHLACMLEKTKHTELLLEYGADVTVMNGNGLHPLQLVPKDAVHSTKLYLKRIFQEALAKKEAAEQGGKIGSSARKDL
jgi:ankyrin repeat protein